MCEEVLNYKCGISRCLYQEICRMVELNIYLSIPMYILISLLLKLFIAYYSLIALIAAFQEVRRQWQILVSKFSQPGGKVSNSYRNDPRNRYLQADLLTLLNGDVAAAKRLLVQQRRNNPGQSDNWYLEKVIYGLERDRR